jgi:hypothetical protein
MVNLKPSPGRDFMGYLHLQTTKMTRLKLLERVQV